MKRINFSKKHIWTPSNALRLLLCAFWTVAIILPLVRMISTMADVDVSAMIHTKRFAKALTQTIRVGCTATVISVVLAMVLSWAIARTGIRHKTILITLLSIPMLIPSISHGMGLIIILGSNGWLSRLIGLEGGIYGFWGIVIGSVMYSFPVAFLMLYDVLRYEDGSPYEAAEVIGLSAKDKFLAITMPYLRKPLIAVVFATFTMIITDYGVPLMVGGKYLTLPVMMYQDVIGMLDFGKGSVIGVILLVPVIITCILDMTNRDKGNASFVGKPYRVVDNRAKKLFARIMCVAVILCVVLPIGSFAVLGIVKKYPIDMTISLKNVRQAVNMGAMKYLWNSVLIAAVVSIVGTLFAVINAYMTARNKSKLGYLLHLMSITSLAIPGLVLGLSYVMFFKATAIYGTFAILFLVNAMHFFSSPYLMAYNTFGKINENLEDVGATMGIGRLRIIKDVILPMSVGTMLEMAGYFFVNCMMTISAVSFLANVNNKPLALMITKFEGQMQLECAAFVSILILAVNVLMKCTVYFLKKVIHKKEFAEQ
ncbi:MAG: ABC transporter permease subunit [Lachnospiraceae bacterium]|nr:ABC transporter permease subunit [Lachnospiraceae bacterium]